MGYFDEVNEGLFTLFSGDNKNLYFDAIKTIHENSDSYSREITRTLAKTTISEMISEHPEYLKRKNSDQPIENFDELASSIITTLKNHGWLNEKSEIYTDNKLYIPGKAIILYEAMKKMNQNNEFEFINSVQRVCWACRGYINKECNPKEYYISVLKPMYEDTMELKNQLTGFQNDFKDMINDLAKDMNEKELNDYLLDVLSGTKMKNYSRILDDESGYCKYSREILKTINLIKAYDLEKFAESYMENSSATGSEDPEQFVYYKLTEIYDFYNSEYALLVNDIQKTITSYWTRVRNKLKMSMEKTSYSENPFETLVKLIGRDTSDSIYCDIRINKLFNLWETKIIDEKSLTHNNKAEKIIVEEVTEDEEDDDISITFESVAEAINKENQRNAENTLKYMKEKFPGKRVIHTSDVKVVTMDDYMRLHDMIRNSLDEDFDFEIEPLEGNSVNIENGECTPFIIRKKGKK